MTGPVSVNMAKHLFAKIHLNSVYPRGPTPTHVPLYNPSLAASVTAAGRAALDTRPDIVERWSETNYSVFVLKMHGDTPTPRATDALRWLEASGLEYDKQIEIARNSTWIGFSRREDAALFKLFWL